MPRSVRPAYMFGSLITYVMYFLIFYFFSPFLLLLSFISNPSGYQIDPLMSIQ